MSRHRHLAAAIGLQLLQPLHSWEPARPERKLEFPRDHGAHRSSAYEWWYWTGHLQNEAGADIAGFQATVFRISPPAGPRAARGNRPADASWIMVHTGFTDLVTGKFHHRKWSFQERAGANLSQDKLKIDVPGLKSRMQGPQKFLLEFTLPQNDEASPANLKLELSSQKPVVLHGDQGYSRKGPCPTCASHYSSFTRLGGQFSLTRQGTKSETGNARVWYDHEFGSQTLASNQTGWDWFSIQLDDPQEEWMLFQVRGGAAKSGSQNDTKDQNFQSATWIKPSGESQPVSGIVMTPDGRWTSPRSGGIYPAAWAVQIPGKETILRVVPRLAEQEVLSTHPAIPTYWEGACDVLDAKSGKKIGRAYLEMTGYAPGSRPGI